MKHEVFRGNEEGCLQITNSLEKIYIDRYRHKISLIYLSIYTSIYLYLSICNRPYLYLHPYIYVKRERMRGKLLN